MPGGERGAAPPSLAKLIEELTKLPGIGRKTAQRLAYHIVRWPEPRTEALSEAIREVKDLTVMCSVCQNLTDQEICPVCSDPNRDRATICVVETPVDVLALEGTNTYRGLYHVLHGAVSPINGVRPEDLKIKELLARAANSAVTELILATNQTAEGELTAMYIGTKVTRPSLSLTRLARGLPTGGSLEHTDVTTISRALGGRQEL